MKVVVCVKQIPDPALPGELDPSTNYLKRDDKLILDESDSGLDVDALQVVADGVNSQRDGERSFIVVTHYQRLLDYIKPDFVHILADGKSLKVAMRH